MAVTVKSKLNSQTLLPLVRQQVAALDKDLPIYHVESMTEYVESARRQTRFVTLLAGVMAGIALLLACAGIYGVTSYSVLQRTKEIGVRIAMGAKPATIFRMVIRQGMFPVAAGLVIGLALSLVLTPLISTLLFGVRPADPVTLFASCIFISGFGLAACLIPARRAVRVDPIVALRYE
jgi:ABC-type antimicrobial peptide transport system permease subunit